ncbi:MAG: TonB-dependent receptor [Cyclobacteriaceae bacterium]
MKTFIQIYLAFFLSLSASSQMLIEGIVQDQNGEGLIGANVYLKDTYDGTTSDLSGYFNFETYEEGTQILIVSFVGYETYQQTLDLKSLVSLKVQLKDAFNKMDAVTITAGAFEASDEKKSVVLKSLDIAMTAGATADIPGALNTLPGTQKNGETGRLFVRGGTSNETKVFIDGTEVANFYGTAAPSIPTRSRFSPFLFKGAFFSTGGYSAEYGQALSSALVLRSSDVDNQSKIDLSLLSVGADASITQSWSDQSIYVKAGYINLNPYNHLISQRIHWRQGTQSIDATAAYKKDFTDGTRLRAMMMTSSGSFKLDQKTILNEKGFNAVDVKNDFLFGTLSFEKPVGESDFFFLGGSYTYNYDYTRFNEFRSRSPIINYHLKGKYSHSFSDKTLLNSGVEFFIKDFEENISASTTFARLAFNQFRPVIFAELDHYLSERWVLRGGLRSEYETYLKSYNLAPRISIAHKLGDSGQVSVAVGKYFQDPEDRFLRFSKSIKQESANHLILNFQRIKEGRVFRVEGYLKDYDKLTRFQDAFDAETYANSGYGYAYGLDLFWRDKSGIKNLDYWISYSWLQSERKFLNFPEKAAPGFTSAHNLSVVTKRWFQLLRSQVGVTYSITSGRPYDDPSKDGFNESLTQVYHDLSYNMAWLPAKKWIVYFSISNVLGQEQTFGYRYAESDETPGKYLSEAVRLPSKRFLLLGCFLTIGSNKNQLENL